jgi:hypothetical protein
MVERKERLLLLFYKKKYNNDEMIVEFKLNYYSYFIQ